MATALNSVEMLLRPFLLRIKPESLTRSFCTSKLLCQDNKNVEPPKEPTEKQENSISKEEKQKQAKAKLNLLLESMAKDVNMKPAESKLNLATPKLRERKPRERKLKMGSEMQNALEQASSSYPSRKEFVKEALIEKLEEVAKETEKAKIEPAKPNKQKTDELHSLLNTLKIEKPVKKSAAPVLGPVKVEEVFAGKASGIFTGAIFTPHESIPKLSTWDKLAQKELELAVTHPPANGFEQMIQWTRQGKLWIFPIDNEQGMDEERNVGFHEHIFLEQHLEPWCPRRGPVRHFMELVCVGLSKNPYLTVTKKKEHIQWFRDFFDSQRKILIETGAIIETSTDPSPRISS